MRILFLSRWYPWPPDNGSKLRIYNLLQALAKAHEVTLLSFAEESACAPADSPLGAICASVRTVPRRPYEPAAARAVIGAIGFTPRYFASVRCRRMEDEIKRAVARSDFDCIVASELDMAAYRDCLGDTPAIFEELELGYVHDRYRHASSVPLKARRWLTWQKHRRYVAGLVERYQAVTVVSPAERRLVKRIAPRGPRITVIPNGIDTNDYTSQPGQVDASRLISTGSFDYEPNYKGMIWFQEFVYPRLKDRIPRLKIVVTGRHRNKPLPHSHSVTRTGYVEDVRPLVAGSACAIVPLREGGGTRLKILEAMALGTPVVATPKGAEGLDVADGRHLLIAHSPEEFADAIVRVLNSSALRRQLGVRARELLSEKYDWGRITPEFLNLVERTALRKSQ